MTVAYRVNVPDGGRAKLFEGGQPEARVALAVAAGSATTWIGHDAPTWFTEGSYRLKVEDENRPVYFDGAEALWANTFNGVSTVHVLAQGTIQPE